MANAPFGARRRALADLARFGSLIVHRGSYVADILHWPELSHEAGVIDGLVKDGFAVKHGDGSIAVTAAGRAEYTKYLEASEAKS